ncbi:MAG: SIR2 family protein [Fimbriimonadaceae bacterium]
MSQEAISETTFLREYARELHNKNAAIFAGAGLSLASGYVDWKGLLREIIQDLSLDPDKEHDLVTLAQYHCNQAGGSKASLTQAIFNHFAPTKLPTANHRILARLPIHTYWTTNYDKLIEKALEDAKKVPDVKYTLKQLSVTRPNRDVAVYKMHGDIDHPAEAVISKDDYEGYPIKMGAFVSSLRGDLVEKTFLFLGFSFSDPNIDYILSRVRVQYEQHQRHHYCIQKAVSKEHGELEGEFKYRQIKQNYFIRDLKRFSIYTILVDDYSNITALLEKLSENYKASSIFISGAAEDYGPWDRTTAEAFLHELSHKIAAKKNRIITGFGMGVGGAVINGALAHLNEAGKTISDEDIVMRPFPQVATGNASLADQWTEYRKAMIDYAGIAIFVFGNKRNHKGELILSNGMRQEFEICVQAGVHPIPVAATGFMSAELWSEVQKNFSKFYPNATAAFEDAFMQLQDTGKRPSELVDIILKLIEHLRKG